MPTPNPFLELDTALYSRLTGDATLMTLVSSVWKGVAITNSTNTPPTTPYIVWANIADTPDDYAGRTVDVFTYDVKVLDDQQYSTRAEAAAAEVMRVLHGLKLTLSTFTNVDLWRTGRRIFRDDGGYWNVVTTFTIRLSIAA